MVRRPFLNLKKKDGDGVEFAFIQRLLWSCCAEHHTVGTAGGQEHGELLNAVMGLKRLQPSELAQDSYTIFPW